MSKKVGFQFKNLDDAQLAVAIARDLAPTAKLHGCIVTFDDAEDAEQVADYFDCTWKHFHGDDSNPAEFSLVCV
jgi:hypothetical protein